VVYKRYVDHDLPESVRVGFKQWETQPKHRILMFPGLGKDHVPNSDPKLASLLKAERRPQALT